MMLCLRLALDGFRKNRRLYLPYWATCTLVVCVFDILISLSISPTAAEMHGGSSVTFVLHLGSYVIAVFSALLLLYTNSFLLRRRKREFGLYSVLGMTRREIGRVLLWETLLGFLGCVGLGLLCGTALNRFCETALLRLSGGDGSSGSAFSAAAARSTVLFYAAIFLLLYLFALLQIRSSDTVTLMKSESSGERPPKARWLPALLGAALLAGAYCLAVSIEQPLEALLYFFVAVITVIIATYLLFITGSIALCRFLQGRKSYYYQTKHFVSVSSMTYRMKRSGAGLASICILLTMVLVMITSSACLYFGKDSAISACYPRNICVFATHYGYSTRDSEIIEQLNAVLHGAVSPQDITAGSERVYYEYSIMGYLENSRLTVLLNSLTNMAFIDYDRVCETHFIRLADYNRLFGTHATLQDGEAIVCAVKTEDIGEVYSVEDIDFHIVERIDRSALTLNGASMASVTANVFLIVNDIDSIAEYLTRFSDYDGTPMVLLRWYGQFDTPAVLSDQIGIRDAIERYAAENIGFDYDGDRMNFYCSCHNAERGDFYGTYSGLFFIGILLSVVFLISAALIVYYKQLCEGYEDQSRFAIMRKVGMTDDDIRESVDAQMRTVFLLPIAAAALHLSFAYPMISKVLMLFSVFDTPLLLKTAVLSVLCCTAVYTLIYRLTSRAYLAIVCKNG